MKSIVGLLLCAAVLLGGCASMERPDPLEPLNRKVFAFNEGLDKVVLKPEATAYEKVVPGPVRTGTGNFFANSRDLWSATKAPSINNLRIFFKPATLCYSQSCKSYFLTTPNLLLQGRGADGMAGMARFGANTVFGAPGCCR